MTSPLSGFRLLAFFPADHAESLNAKVYVHGGFWNRLNFPSFPQTLNLTLVAVVEVPFAKYQKEHSFAIGMEDADSEKLPLEVRGTFRVGANPDMEYGDPTIMPVAVPVSNLAIPRPADYVFTFDIDDERLGRYAFRAVQLQIPLQFQLGQQAPPDSEAS